MLGIGVGVVKQVDGVAGSCLPGKDFDEAVALDMDDALVAGEPAKGVMEEMEQVFVAGEPVCALDVSGKIGDAAGAGFTEHDSGLGSVGDGRIGELGRILNEAGNYGEDGIGHRLERDAVL